jgi:hypothetical protein
MTLLTFISMDENNSKIYHNIFVHYITFVTIIILASHKLTAHQANQAYIAYLPGGLERAGRGYRCGRSIDGYKYYIDIHERTNGQLT